MSLKLCLIRPERGVSSKFGGVLALLRVAGFDLTDATELSGCFFLLRRTVPDEEFEDCKGCEFWEAWPTDERVELRRRVLVLVLDEAPNSSSGDASAVSDPAWDLMALLRLITDFACLLLGRQSSGLPKILPVLWRRGAGIHTRSLAW